MKRNLSLALFVLLGLVVSLGTASAAGKKTALLLPIVPGDTVDVEATERMDEKLGEAFKAFPDLKISTMADFEESAGKASSRKLLRCGTDLDCIDKLVARSPFDMIIVAKADKAGEKELDVRFTLYNVVEGNKKQVTQTCSSEKFGDKRAQVWSEEILEKAMALLGGSKGKEVAEEKAPKESLKDKKAREAREKAEALKAVEETKRAALEEKKRAAEEAKRAAVEEKKRQAEEAKRAVEEKKAREEEAKRVAAEKRAKEDAERKATEEKKRQEAEVKRFDDEALAADAEVTRLEKALAEAKRVAADKHLKAKDAKRAAGMKVSKDEEKIEKAEKPAKSDANLDDEDDAGLWKAAKNKKGDKPEKIEKAEKADKKADKKAEKAEKEKAEKAEKADKKRAARDEDEEEDAPPPPPKVKKPVLPTKEEVQENIKKAYSSFVSGDLDNAVSQINAAVEKRCGCDADGDAYTMKAMLESFSGIWKKIDAAQKSQDSKNIIANLDEMKTLERELAKSGKKIGVDKESKYAKEMNASFAKGYLFQAKGQIKAFNYIGARDSLKKALEQNPKESEAQTELDKMPEYAKRLLSQAQSETDYDPDGAIRKLKQVVELVGADSATGKQAQKKLKELEE